MDRLLKSPWFVKVAAFLIALMMYTTVHINDQQANEDDQSLTDSGEQIFKNVSLDVEYDNNKYVLLGNPDTVGVRFQGSKSDIMRFGLQRTPRAYIDLTDKGAGQYDVPIKFENVPSGIDAIPRESTVNVTLHEKKTESFPVTVQLLGEDDLPKGYIAGTPQAEKEEIEITGAKEMIDEIAYVRVFVNVADEKETFTRQAKVQALNKSFDPVDIKIEPDTMNVTVPIENPSKDVPVTIEERGSLPDGYELKSITSSQEEVAIHAPEKVLEKLNSISLPVDLSNITEDETIDMDVPLPEGAFYASPGKLKVKIDVEKTEDETSTEPAENETVSSKTFNDLPIKVIGLDDNEEASFNSPNEGVMDVTVNGNEEDLNNLSEENITAFVDAKNLSEGQHDVKINVDVPERFTFESHLTEATLTISKRTA
ncbi:YbbR-like domain-containing protein [Alkalihalobacillus sp. TS-13]|uniref:CdaR family protein n=1 Tax=Alkalihalobacillus sp. TS-13 TaxID=2842455 RepID=UPI001C885019|nr:CdaR family protein [Alkalihalobacillus sp. TS-13]